MEKKNLSLSLLCLMVHIASVLSVSLNSNLTVVLEDWNMQNVSLPLVDAIIFECSDNTQLNATWNADVTNCSRDGRLLNCRSLSASDATISCTTSSGVNYTVSVTVVDDLVVFVNKTFYYVRQDRTQLLDLNADATPRDVEVTIPCIPVGEIDRTPLFVMWSFRRFISDNESKDIQFPDVKVMFDNVTGDSGITLQSAILRMNRATSLMAGQYKCDVGSPSALEKVLYWGPQFNEYDFQNSSATEGYHDPELWCEGRFYPRDPIIWQRCSLNGENCYDECNGPVNLTHGAQGGKYEFLDIPPFPFGSRLRIRGAQTADRGCYRCIIGSIAVPQTHYVFLRIRGRLAVLWPILGLLVEFLIVALFILGAHVYQLWKKKQKPPARSASGGSDINSLLPNESLAQDMRSLSVDSSAERARRRTQPEPSLSQPGQGYQSSDV